MFLKPATRRTIFRCMINRIPTIHLAMLLALLVASYDDRPATAHSPSDDVVAIQATSSMASEIPDSTTGGVYYVTPTPPETPGEV